MLEVGSTVDGWQIDAVIHQGSMATTYAVSRDGDAASYAMKLLFLREPSFQERLRRAGATLRGIRHPNLLPIVDVCEMQGLVAVVSQFVDGTDLTGWCATDRTLIEIIQLFRKIALGLRAAHSHGLVHRNLKPSKVLVDLTNRPYIHDFMLGKVLATADEMAVTQMGTTFGTPQYMAPEQFRGASAVDQRADVFSMGCLLFEMLTRRRAFDGNGLMEIYKQVANGDRPRVHDIREDCPEAVEALLVELLQPDADDRLPSIRELVNRLDTDPALRALVNPSFSTATPVSALTSDRAVHKRVTLDAPADQRDTPPNVVAVTPAKPMRQLPAQDDTPGPAPLQDTAPVEFGHSATMSQDSRPSLITFTDGHSQDSAVGHHSTLAKLDAAPPPPKPPPPPGVSPQFLFGVLALLFVLAMAIGAALTAL